MTEDKNWNDDRNQDQIAFNDALREINICIGRLTSINRSVGTPNLHPSLVQCNDESIQEIRKVLSASVNVIQQVSFKLF